MNKMPIPRRRLRSILAGTLLLAVNSAVIACGTVHGDDPATIGSEVAAPPDATYADTVEAARQLVRAAMVDGNLPGLSIAVGVDGEIVWAEGFGWADVDQRRPVTPATRFRIGSVAMALTATGVGLLQERGVLDLDAPVQDYVPGFPGKEWPVTTRQLMAHIAGVRGYGDDEELLYMRRHCDRASDGLEAFANDPLRFEPGTRYRFSDYGWTLVGAAIEGAADEPFQDFMQREVLDPLELRDTALDDPAGPAAERASFYWPRIARDPSLGVESAIRSGAENTCVQGAGALLSTPTDVVRFGLATLEGRLLGAETLEAQQTPVTLDSGETTGHGLGWFVTSTPMGPADRPTPVFGQAGSAAGGTTVFAVLPEYRIAIAIATNVSFAESLAIERELGGGVDPFFHESSLPKAVANAFVLARATGRQ